MSKTFEEKSFILRLSEHMDAVAWSKTNDRYYAWQHALWSYQQGIRDAVEKLRSAQVQVREDVTANIYAGAADYLEEQVKRDGV